MKLPDIFKIDLLCLLSNGILFLYACNSKKSIMIKPMNREFKNDRVSFVALNKSILFNYKDTKEMSQDQLLKVIDTLSAALENKEPSYTDDYYTIYNLYWEPIEYKTYFKARLDDAKHNLNLVKNRLLKGERNIDLSYISQLYRYYQYSYFFKEQWFITPVIYFSKEFYTKVLSKQSADILLNSYQWDDSGNNSYLQVFKLLSNNSKYIIQPHYVDDNMARHMLEKLKKTNNKLLNSESKFFKILLQKVIDGEIELIVYNDNT